MNTNPYCKKLTEMLQERKVVLYIAMSLDGYIAAPGDDLSFLSLVEKEGEDYGYAAFVEKVDTVIMGRKTYDWVMKQVAVFPHADKKTYVLTRTEKPATGNLTFYTGDVTALVRTLKSGEGQNIFIDGGAEVVYTLLKEQLIDEFVISIIPVILGNGTRLFRDGFPQQVLCLKDTETFTRGLVQLTYTRRV